MAGYLMKITVAHSPDSDDAFMHYGLASGKVPTDGIEFGHLLADIETLNRAAFEGKYEVSAVSFNAYAHLTDKYLLLPHGSSMGDDYGPIVVARTDGPSSTKGIKVAVPGELTTSFMALRIYDPDVDYVVMPFDKIQDAVKNGEVPAGLLIHEGQLTYGDRGLHLWADMGEWWHAETGLPLPLGGNVVRRDLGDELLRAIARDMKASIEYGLAHRAEALRHAQGFSRGLDAIRTDRFIGMYVNDYTVDYGPRGRKAVVELFQRGHRAGLIPGPIDVTFLSANP